MAQDSVSVDRWKYIGGSDIPIIMNLSPYKSRFELLQEKARLRDDDFEGNKYTEYGNIMEPQIREYFSKEKALEFKEGKHYLTYDDFGIRIHTDGEDALGTIIEIKTTSQVHADLLDYKMYLVQLLFYMKMTGTNTGYLLVYERPDDFSTLFDPDRLQVFPVILDYHEELVKDILRAVSFFINDLHKLQENPFLTSGELIPEDAKELSRRLVELKEQEMKLKEIIAEKEFVEEKLAGIMESNSVKTFDEFGWKMTRIAGKEASVKIVDEFDEAKLKEEHPEIWLQYVNKVEKESNGKKVQIKMTRLSNEN